MLLPDYENQIQYIWYEVLFPSDKATFTPNEDNNNQFDVVLKRESNTIGFSESILMKFEEQYKENQITLGNINYTTRRKQEIQIQYKIKSFNGLLSSGSLIFNHSPIPNEFVFDPAYPNPFNPITKIKYGIPIAGNLSLAIYDLKGRLVKQLVDDQVSEGYYEIFWDGSFNASGIYFIQLSMYDSKNSLKFNSIQKIMMIK